MIVLWRLLNVEAKSKAYIQWFRPIGIHSASFPPHSSPTLIPIPSLSIVHQKKKERKKERQTMLRMVIQFFFMLVFCKTLLWVPLAGEFTIVEESSHVQGIEAHVLKQSAEVPEQNGNGKADEIDEMGEGYRSESQPARESKRRTQDDCPRKKVTFSDKVVIRELDSPERKGEPKGSRGARLCCLAPSARED